MSELRIDLSLTGEDGAAFSKCGGFRYRLWRRLRSTGNRRLVFCMLNPSLAGAVDVDPTTTRCIGFGTRWARAYDILEQVNAYARITPEPSALLRIPEELRIGDHNDAILREVFASAADVAGSTVCFAWGAARFPITRKARLAELARSAGVEHVFCLGRTKAGEPRHPLFVRGDQPFEPFTLAEAA